MILTLQLPFKTAKIVYRFFDVHLCLPTLKKVPPPMATRAAILHKRQYKCWYKLQKHLSELSRRLENIMRHKTNC